MGDHEVAAGMPDREVQRIELRNKNKSEAMEAYYRGAVKLSLIIGAVGTAGHLIANKRWPAYQRLYYGAKTFLVSSSFAMGWWIGGENAFQDWHRAHYLETTSRKRRALQYMAEKKAAQQKLGIDVGPAMAVESAKQ